MLLFTILLLCFLFIYAIKENSQLSTILLIRAFYLIMIVFVLINIFSGIYILYNKNFIDMFSITVISQIMMSFAIMAMTFFGRWFAFPRTIVFINFIVSTLVLAIW